MARTKHDTGSSMEYAQDGMDMMAPVEVAVAAPVAAPVAPTLQEAFTALCCALEPLLEESLPDQTHCQEIQGWYANGNHVISWAHAVQLLEQVLGQHLLP